MDGWEFEKMLEGIVYCMWMRLLFSFMIILDERYQFVSMISCIYLSKI